MPRIIRARTPGTQRRLHTFAGTWRSLLRPPDFATAVDERELATVVAALVTRAGWTFQPILFDFQRGA